MYFFEINNKDSAAPPTG